MKKFSWDVIDGAIFDLDGTLVDSMGFWKTIGSTYVKLKGFEPEPDIHRKLRPLTIIQAAEYYKETYGIDLDRETIIKECNGVMEEAYTTKIFLKSGVKEFLQLLSKRNIPMYVASATDRHLVEISLKKLDIENYFIGLITSTEAGSGKAESASIFDIAREKMGTTLAKTVIFEDAFHAIKTAKKAGYPIAALYDDSAKSHTHSIKELADWYGVTFDEYIEVL